MVCTQDRCRRAQKYDTSAGRPAYYTATVPVTGESEEKAGRTMRVTVRVFVRHGRLLKKAKARGKLGKGYRPNGPDCEPVCCGVGFKCRGDTNKLKLGKDT